MNTSIVINLQRCTGCWTCSMACKVGNALADSEWRHVTRTLGSGEGVDRPSGVWPNLHMSWLPIWLDSCDKCAARIASGEQPYCVVCCPNGAITYGEDVTGACDELERRGIRFFSLPEWENTRGDVLYAQCERNL